MNNFQFLIYKFLHILIAVGTFRPTLFHPMQFQPLPFQPLTISIYCIFIIPQFRPKLISSN